MSGPFQQQRFYRPYSSDSDSDSGSESDTSSSSWYSSGSDQQLPPRGTTDGIPNFRAFASQLQLKDAGGPSFSTTKDQLAFGGDRVGRITYSEFGKPPDIPTDSNYGTTSFKTNRDAVTSMIMINSKDRDRSVYAQPTFFKMQLPRVYRNVINIQLQQVKLLTSFYYFRPDKKNVTMNILEKDRDLIPNASIDSLGVVNTIATGSYSINSLISEITKQLNFVPLFYDFPGGFNEFLIKFRSTGDLGLNFNEAGDWAYNGSTQLWQQNPTKNDIISVYWKQRYLGAISYSVNQALVAYYYPPLWEYLYDPETVNAKLNLDVAIGYFPFLLTTDDVATYLLNQFTGINDPVALLVIQANLSVLDQYRDYNTFKYANVNKYEVTLEANSQKVIISTKSLNTSLVNLLNQQAARFFSRALQFYGLTSNQYASIVLNSQKTLAVLQDMYSFTQSNFLNYFAVPWSQYSLDYYANTNYTILLQNGVNAVGIPSNDVEALSSGVVTISNDILQRSQTSSITYWPAMSTLSSASIYLENLSTATFNYNYPFRIQTLTIDSNHRVIDSNQDYVLYSEYLTKSVNAVCPVNAGEYTVFKFRSPVRQTIQVETLPRPTAYRVPLYNDSNYPPFVSTFFDISYVYVDPANSNANSNASTPYDFVDGSNILVVPGWSATTTNPLNPGYTYGLSYASSLSNWVNAEQLDVTAFQRALFGTFYTPQVQGASPSSNYKYEFQVNIEFYSSLTSQELTPPNQVFRAFLYHDRAAFQADALFVRNENPRFWKYSTIISPSDVSTTFSFYAYPNQQYYITLRADDFTFGTTFPKILPFFPSSFQLISMTRALGNIDPATDPLLSNFDPTLINCNWNYAQVYDKDFLRLPITSTLWAPDPTVNPATTTYTISNVPMGYDVNDVSNDFTDYIPFTRGSYCNTFNPSVNLGIDPITQYQFQSNSPYNSTTMSYFYPGTLNQQFYPSLSNTYTQASTLQREVKIVHYYSLNYIPNSEITPNVTPLIGTTSNAQLPYSISTTSTAIKGYQYDTPYSTLQLSLGVLGFTILPQDGVWDVPRLMFRSAIQDSNSDPNAEIAYMAIYNMGDILSTNTLSLSMSTAIFVLSNSARVTYTASTLQTILTADDFDVKGGTYYEFKKDSNFAPNSNAFLLGYQQQLGSMRNQPESIYTAIAFNQYGAPITIKALSGSAIPYPLYNNAHASTTYTDGTYAPNSNRGVVIPEGSNQTLWPWVGATNTYSNFKPPTGNDGSQSQYSLSIPIGTTALNYKIFIPPTEDSNYLQPWTTTHTPTNIVTNIPNYALLQDTSFHIYEYPLNGPVRAFTDLVATLSYDDVYPLPEATSLVGVNGNSSAFYFLGLSSNSPSALQIRLKKFDPLTQQLTQVTTSATLTLPISSLVKSFTINNSNQIVITARDVPNNTTRIYFTPNNYLDTGFSNHVILSNLDAVHDSDPLSDTIWFLQQDLTGRASTIGTGPITTLATIAPTYYTINTATGPLFYNGLGVNTKSEFINLSNDEVVLFTTDGTQPIYRRQIWFLSSFTGGGGVSSIAFATDMSTIQTTTEVVTGYGGSFWVCGTGSQPLWGNRRTEVDTNGVVDTAWQIFYPCQKVNLVLLSNTYNPITDLKNLDYPEYPHVNMFYYNSTADFLADVTKQWGHESNFVTNDTLMSGYYFNSYIFNMPIQSNTGTADYHYLVVRGFAPTEKYETLIRFFVPNIYDFGFLTFQNIIQEISLNSSNPTLFNPLYSYALSNFNTQFIQSNYYYGQGLLQGFDGSNISTTGYSSFHYTYSTIYGNYLSNANLISAINGYVTTNINGFISSQLVNILPASALLRENYTDPLTFSILWRSQLEPAYIPLQDDWGLGYNLGYDKRDTPYNTVAKATSFYKILDDYIYLRLNPEEKMNMMDSAAKEDLAVTRDPTGQIQQYYGKLLLNNFNSFSQTMVTLPVQFNPPLGRLAQMSFQWVNLVGEQINNGDCEWSAAIQIVESLVQPVATATFPALPPPK